MWPRLIIRELLPLLPRLLRLIPLLEKNFGGPVHSPNVSPSPDFMPELQAQIAQVAAEGRRDRREMQSQLEDMQQQMGMLRGESELMEKKLNQLQDRTRLIFILSCVLAGLSGVLLVLVAVLMARISR
ncbi:MAG TPA: hypothetical protein VFZ99_04290 [Terriglobales bacterium]